jgi:hypothetical protein
MSRCKSVSDSDIQLVDVGLLGCDTIWTCRQVPVYWMNMLPPFSLLKIDSLFSSKTLLSTYKSSWHHKPEAQHQHLLCYDNFKPHILKPGTILHPFVSLVSPFSWFTFIDHFKMIKICVLLVLYILLFLLYKYQLAAVSVICLHWVMTYYL